MACQNWSIVDYDKCPGRQHGERHGERHVCCAPVGPEKWSSPIQVVDDHEEDAWDEHPPEHLLFRGLQSFKLADRQMRHMLVGCAALHRRGFLHKVMSQHTGLEVTRHQLALLLARL